MLKFDQINEQTEGEFEIIALISQAEIKLTKNGRDYFQLELSTKEGVMSAKLWNITPQDRKTLKAGKVIQANAKINIYNGNLGLVITDPEVIELDPSEFKVTAVEPVNELEKEFMEIANSIKHEQLHAIVQDLIEDPEFKEHFFIWPAAKSHHHAEEHGLLMHTTRMLRIANAVVEEYNRYKQVVNRDLVLTGIIFHDIAKLKEMEPIEGTGSGAYTPDGILLGHIYMGTEKIANYEFKGMLDHEVARQLKHIILSHHGKLEYGAPVEPHTVEARIVNMIDDMDAKTFELQTNMLRLRDGEIDANNWTYRPLPIE